MICAKKQAPSPNKSIWDFPEDELPEGPECRIKDGLILALVRFGRSLIKNEFETPDEIFHPQFTSIFESGSDAMRLSLFSAFTDWIHFDHAIDEEGRTVADLYQIRKKLQMTGLQKQVLKKMREAVVDLYEVQALYPGKGMVLRCLDDGKLVEVIEMTGSRTLKRSALVACRPWLFDGAHRISGSIYDFKPKHRHDVEKAIALLLDKGLRHGRNWRERFFPEMFRLWVEKNVKD